MKLALYLPNFRTEVTIKELEDLTDLAEELDFDSVWTLDRIVVPEASDRGELQYSFGMMDGLPNALPVASTRRLLPGLPADPVARGEDVEGAHRDEHHRHARSARPGCSPRSWPPSTTSSDGRLNVGLGAGWMPEEFAAASAAHIFPKRHKHVRETIEVLQGVWANEHFEYHGEFADFDRCGFGAKPLQQPRPPIFMSGLKDPLRAAKRISKYDLDGFIGIQDSPDSLGKWLTAIDQQFEEIGSPKRSKDLEICSMIWTVITDEETDQTDNGVPSNLLVGTEKQLTDRLKAYKEAGLTMPLIWPPFTDVPVAKTLDDLKRIKNDIMPKVEAA